MPILGILASAMTGNLNVNSYESIMTATVSTAAVRPTVSRNIVLKLDTSASDATYGYETGLAVTSYPQIQDQ